MASNGHKYELTENLEMWTTTDLIHYINDTEAMMGLEKHQVLLMAQEAALRLEAVTELDYDEDEDNEDDGEFND